MNLHPVKVALCIFIGSQVTSALVWRANSLPDNATLSACQGQNVTLHWQYDRDNAEHLRVEEWHFLQDGGNSDRLLAARVHGQFVPEAGNSVQLEYLPNAGIRLLNVSLQSSGLYYVKVMFNVHDSVVTYRRNVHVQVTANADVVTNGHLTATVQPGATYDNQTKDYHVVLACSKINGAWGNSTRILWTTPDHKVLQTSWWHHGVAYLSVPNPVATGDYTCKLDQSPLALKCSTSQSPPVSGATVHLDGVGARLSILEGELQGLQNRENELQGKVDSLQAENQVLKQQLALTSQSVSFDVNLQTRTTSSAPLHFNEATTNEGGAFNMSLAKFVTPLNGTYVFHLTLVSSNPSSDNSDITVFLVVDGQKTASAMTSRVTGYYNTGSVDVVKPLLQGQRVWVVNGSDELTSRPISFSVSLVNSSHYSSQPVVFTHIISNQGQAFNTTSGQFTVPIAGLYVFHLTVTTTNPVPDSSVDSVYFMIDQHPWRVAESGRPSGYYDTGSMSMVKRMAKGQKVGVHNRASGWHSLPFSLYFSGFLLRAGS